MATNETNEPDRDVDAAAVRALDALARVLDGFAKLAEIATDAAKAEVQRRQR